MLSWLESPAFLECSRMFITECHCGSILLNKCLNTCLLISLGQSSASVGELVWILDMILITCWPWSMQWTSLNFRSLTACIEALQKEEGKARISLESASKQKLGNSVDHMTIQCSGFCWCDVHHLLLLGTLEMVPRSSGTDTMAWPIPSALFPLCSREDLTVLGPSLWSVPTLLCWSS